MATYFTDRDLAKRFPEVLASSRISVEPFHRHFGDAAEDDEWIPAVARRGWVGVTHNKRIRYTPNELDAVFRSGLGLLVLIGGASTLELAQNFVRTYRRVEQFVTSHRPPYIAKVYRASSGDLVRNAEAPGRIEMWKDSYP